LSEQTDAGLTTEIASHDLHHIWIRGHDLTADVMGKRTFGEVVFLLVSHRLPDPQELRLIDAVLVSLMEHGLTPSAIVARVTYSVASESLQGAVAAGLLGAGSLVLGSMEECGRLLDRIAAEVRGGSTSEAAAQRIAEEYRKEKKKLPGVGHVIHTEGDPRAERLFVIAGECGKRGPHVQALEQLVRAAEALAGRKLPINVTGAVAAVLLELGVPWQLHRGFALISRSAGLVAHIGEELERPITPGLRKLAREPAKKP
jgi:citrate synthase